MKKVVFLILFLTVLIPGARILLYKYEGEKPVVDMNLPSLYLKKSYEIALSVEDKKTGLRDIRVSIHQRDKEKILLKREYESSGFAGISPGAAKTRDSFIIPVHAWQYGMTDGEASIRIRVSDDSWRGWNTGNILNIEKKVIIDFKPPKVDILTRHHNIEKGGSGLIIYQLFEEDIKSGVQVGDNFFPGYPGLFDDKNIYTAFFALSDMQGPGTRLSVTAKDPAGNITRRGFHHYIRDEKFKPDILNISDSFLNRKVSQFDIGEKNGSFENKKNPLLEKFLYINSHVRKKSVEQVLEVSQKSENKKMWEGRFLRLRGSARKSGFAERRIYKYKGDEIDRAIHYGIDLASTANASIEAGNSGRVIFAQFAGIFGNSVIIDHGFGLCSLYSHLSQILVNPGDMVERGDEIGLTGLTGLAGGDHLHFSIIVHNIFVNPVEWWDKTWIENNITSKIDYVREIE